MVLLEKCCDWNILQRYPVPAPPKRIQSKHANIEEWAGIRRDQCLSAEVTRNEDAKAASDQDEECSTQCKPSHVRLARRGVRQFGAFDILCPLMSKEKWVSPSLWRGKNTRIGNYLVTYTSVVQLEICNDNNAPSPKDA